MALIINTNIASINAQRNLASVTQSLNESLERLSSGLRINRASDDAAGLAVAESLRGRIRSLNQAIRNANDGISMIGIAEGSLQVISDTLLRMRELAEQAASGTLTNTERSAIQTEFSNLQSEINRIANTTEFNNINIINSAGPTYALQIGVENSTNDRIIISAIDVQTSALGVSAIAVSTQGAAQSALTSIDSAITLLARKRGELGAVENRLSATVSNLQNAVEKNSAAESAIRDADIAGETASLVRNQVLQQAAVAMLAQANQIPALALTLLT